MRRTVCRSPSVLDGQAASRVLTPLRSANKLPITWQPLGGVMSSFVRILGLGLLLALAAVEIGPARAQNPTAASAPGVPTSTALAGFDEYVAQTLAEWDIPGLAISVVRDGEVVLAGGYGARDPVSSAAMSENTIFPIASMSKAFTSFSAALLVDEGRMSFDAPVSTYLPGLALHDPAASAGLTLRDMLSHRSGLPRHDGIWYHNAGLTREALIPRMPHLEESAPFRARFQYNNIMFVLSGLAVERVAGEPWEAFTRARIFTPLGMTRTMFSPDQAAADPDHTSGTEILNGERINVPLFRNTPILNPAGGVYSTAADLAAWMRVHLSEGRLGERQIVTPATLADMHATHMVTGATIRDPEIVPTGYGLGWFTNIYRGRGMIQHGGNLNGVSTLVAMIPEARLGVTVLVNQGGSELRDAMARAVLDRFLGETGKDWVGEALARKQAGEALEVEARANLGESRVRGTDPSHAVADYAGTYFHPGYGELTISREGRALAAAFNDDRSPLEHFHYDVFDAATEDVENLLLDGRIQFQMDMYGRVSALRTALEPQIAPIEFARQADARLSDPAYLSGLAGEYDFAGNRLTIALSGRTLQWIPAGGIPADLLPSLGGEFAHERRLDARIAFEIGADGKATGLTLTDASGVYEAARVD